MFSSLIALLLSPPGWSLWNLASTATAGTAWMALLILEGPEESHRIRRFRIVLEILIVLFSVAAGASPVLLFFVPVTLGGSPPLERSSRRDLIYPGAVLLFGGTALYLAARSRPGEIETLLMFPAALCGGFFIKGYITRIRMKEEERTEDIRKRLKTRDGLISTLAHEIRTPLTVIQSTVDILHEGRTGPLTREQGDFLLSVSGNVRRLVSLSDNLLASIKVDADWFTLRLSPLDLRRTIRNVVSHMSPFLEEKGQNLRYSFPNLLSRPLADENWIHQVLVNLVHNASKHLPSGGSIIISVNENEQCVVISVSDNGSGIEISKRTSVFDEFYQGDEYEEARLEGAGLGLTIVQKVIEKHEGKVYVGSVRGQGTTVSFTLPKIREKHP